MSATCTFCVFGWNMERLGFGNMYVHAFTFILLCVAPLLIFSVTALNVYDDDIRDAVVAVGVGQRGCARERRGEVRGERTTGSAGARRPWAGRSVTVATQGGRGRRRMATCEQGRG